MSELTYRRMRDQVVDLLRQEILLGKFAEGNPLREIPLAERFRTSRGPIRDAILQLTQEGLLASEPNRGAKVAGVWDEELRPLMVQIRFELESYAVWKITERKPAPDLATFRRNLRSFEIACRDKDFGAVVQLDMEFHRLLLRESGAGGLEAVWLSLMGGMRLPYSRHSKLTESFQEHRAIVEAIAQGRGKEAIRALKKNIR
jgi:DNA-binding GntR family transcriptional regulator